MGDKSLQRKEIRRLRTSLNDKSVEEYKLKNECCYFHTNAEFKEFSNEKDDVIE